MPYLPYVAHDPLYRSKMTAVAEGESLRLRLLLHNDAKCTSAFLEICPDGGESFSLEMGYKCPSDENYNWWECEFSLSEGLYWYSFYYFGEGGKHYVTKHERGIGLVSGSGGKWQLTIYSRDFETPFWPQNGIIYQIFPDRFFASGEEKENIPTDRFIRSDWGSTPAWKNDGSEFSICNDYFCGDIRGIIQKLDYIEAFALVIHIALLYGMLQLGIGINAVIFANIIFAVIVCASNYFYIKRFLNYRVDYIRTFVVPLIASVIMGVVIGVISLLINKLVGNILTVIICTLIGIIVYAVAIILLRGVSEDDFNDLPGGQALFLLVKKFKLM